MNIIHRSCNAAVSVELFGLLANREVPELSVRLFELIRAVALVNGSLTVTISKRDGEDVREIAFLPRNESDEPEAVISDLYEKFADADIARR